MNYEPLLLTASFLLLFCIGHTVAWETVSKMKHDNHERLLADFSLFAGSYFLGTVIVVFGAWFFLDGIVMIFGIRYTNVGFFS